MSAFIVGPGFGVGVLLIPLVSYGATMWAILDISEHTRAVVYGAGYSKAAWIVVLMLCLPTGLGVVPSLVYLLRVRPRARDVERRLSR